MMACITLNKHKITCNMSESASFKFWGIDTHYKVSLLCYVSHTADTTPFVFLAEERWYSLPLSWQIRGFPAPGLRKPSWDTPEVLVHEETFEDKTGAMAMAILRGDDGQMTVLSSHVQAVWKCFFENVKTLAWNDCLLEVFRRGPNLQEHPTCEKNRLFNDGAALHIIFYCLDIYQFLDRIWICINIVDFDILGWACCHKVVASCVLPGFTYHLVVLRP